MINADTLEKISEVFFTGRWGKFRTFLDPFNCFFGNRVDFQIRFGTFRFWVCFWLGSNFPFCFQWFSKLGVARNHADIYCGVVVFKVGREGVGSLNLIFVWMRIMGRGILDLI